MLASVQIGLRTQSEALFEQYLESQNLKWERIPESDQKVPDYEVFHAQGNCVFEVKEFADLKKMRSLKSSLCAPIKGKIRQASGQFTDYKDSCCALVLWNFPSTIPAIVLSAAFGEQFYEIRAPLGAQPTIYQFFGRSELRSDCNTRFSAIVVLNSYQLNHVWLEAWRRLNAKQQKGEEINPFDQILLLEQVASEGITSCSYQGTIRGVVLENPYAKIPFPPDLFVGPFDQHWHMDSGCFKPYFMGSELQRLKNEGVPFILL